MWWKHRQHPEHDRSKHIITQFLRQRLGSETKRLKAKGNVLWALTKDSEKSILLPLPFIRALKKTFKEISVTLCNAFEMSWRPLHSRICWKIQTCADILQELVYLLCYLAVTGWSGCFGSAWYWGSVSAGTSCGQWDSASTEGGDSCSLELLRCRADTVKGDTWLHTLTHTGNGRLKLRQSFCALWNQVMDVKVIAPTGLGVFLCSGVKSSTKELIKSHFCLFL